LSLKRSVLANYVGQTWTGLIGIAFVPIYLHHLGVEAYGLVGVFAVLQSWLTLLDIGLKPSLGREMARFTGGAVGTQDIADLLRSVEIIVALLATLIFLGIWLASQWLATRWLHTETLPSAQVAQAIVVMGLVVALRFLEDMYVSSIIGLQRQVLQNVAAITLSTLRALGAVAVLVYVSSTIHAFFIWQAVVSIVTVATYGCMVHLSLPRSRSRPRFSVNALLNIRRFAGGMIAITALAIVLTQVDKLLLSRLLTLRDFAYYTIAGVVANGLYMLAGPVATAYYPRFTALVANSEDRSLRAAYHQSAQIVSVIMGSAAIVLILFGQRVLLVWTNDAALSARVAPLLSLLALGTMLHGLMWIPYQLQLANGWTALAIRINIVAVAILVPAIVLIVPIYGAQGAAVIWVILNLSYVVFDIYLMHRRLIPQERQRWYVQDVGIPLLSALLLATLLREFWPGTTGRVQTLVQLTVTSVVVVLGSSASAPYVRQAFTAQILDAMSTLRGRRA
jgi:O-antigen/teichoic acid export membrane protein